jgi:beta-1,4-N-acetylglucosaminyltransferase
VIFLTLGTFPLSFDRILVAIDELCGEGVISDELFGQIGLTKYTPRHFRFVNIMGKEEYDDVFNKADAIISHAGMGSISMALQRNKPLLVIPRLAKYKEVVNDHQVGTARKFESLGHVLAAYDTSELPEKIEMLKTFIPTPRSDQAVLVAARIKRFLESMLS